MRTLTGRCGAAVGMLAVGMALSLALFASPASAEVHYCTTTGSGAGQCSNPQGIAANTATGNLYVVERGNHRVSVFASSGAFLFAFGWDVIPGGGTGLEQCTTASGCKAGSSGPGAGQFQSPSRIAIDNTGGPEQGKVYVGTDSFRVQKFNPDGSFSSSFGTQGAGLCQFSGTSDPIAIGPGGNVFVADSSGNEPNFTARVEKFSPAGACLGETVLIVGNAVLKALAIDSAEDAWVSVDRVSDELRKYDLGSPETLLCSPAPGINTNALAIGPGNSLYASQREGKDGGGIHQVITEYEAACSAVQRFGYEKIAGNLVGLAFLESAEGDIFAGEGEELRQVHYLTIPPLGPVTVPSSVEAPSVTVGNAKATIKAEVNPEGKETSVVVDYLDDAHFDSEGGFESPETKTSDPVLLPAGFTVKAVSVPIGCPVASKQLIEEGKCLTPETEYHFRVRATNADNPSGAGEGTAIGTPFITKQAIEVVASWSTEVGTDSATLNAVVNPLGIPASGHFEYVTDAQFQASGFAEAVKAPNPDPPAEEAEIDFGAEEAEVKRSATVYPLAPGTTYHYRLAAINPLIEAFQLSEAKTFKTFEEEASPPCPNDPLRFGPSALLPDCRAFEMVSPLDKANGDIVVLKEGVSAKPATLNQAATSGSRLAYGTYRAFGDAKSAPYTSQYISSRSEAGWQSHAINPPRDGLIPDSVAELSDSEYRAYSEDLCQGWIVPLAGPTLAPGANEGYRNLYRRSDSLCAPESYATLSDAAPENIGPGPKLFVELQGLSGDGSIAAFAANDSLEGSGAPANPTGKIQLYMKGAGTGPRFACILPGGAAASTSCTAGSGPGPRFGNNRYASVTNALSADGKRLFWSDSAADGEIYLRENPLGEGGECENASAPCTIAVSAQGEGLSGTGSSHFWAAAKDGSAAIFTTGGDLYTFTVAGEATEEIAGGVLGLVGASEDASRIYFASTEALAAGAQAGKANLYLYEAAGAGSYRFIGILSSSDVNPGTSVNASSPVAEVPVSHNGRVSPSGLHAAFMSAAPLTGYDNTDAASGEADAEVFLYDAAANGGAGELVCASCNPSGARPAGRNAGSEANPFWVAAQIPVFESTLYAPRVLAEDGTRLYFESRDALVGRDANGRIDVYQWERAGTGGCTTARSTYSPAAGGCVDLISSGDSVRDSEFIDASPSGEDVFFATLSKLYPSDYGLVDIYDARAGGGFAAPPPGEVECEGEECQNPPPAPQAPTPPSATYVGPGNIPPEAKKPRPCPKGKHKAKQNGKTKCVKNKKKGKRQKSERASAERRAGR